MADLFVNLNHGKVAVLDESDAALVVGGWFAWCHPKGQVWYPKRNIVLPDGRRTCIVMHTAIMGPTPAGFRADHEDGDGLNNRRVNLRFVTHATNMHNVGGARRNNRHSDQLGVCWVEALNRWKAAITFEGRSIHLGVFPAFDDAVAARLVAERDLWGIEPRRMTAHHR